MKLLITRPHHAGRRWQRALQACGVEGVLLPTMVIAPVAGWQQACPACFTDADVVIFVSQHAVGIVQALLPSLQGSLAEKHVWAVGAATAECLMEQGIVVDEYPRETSGGAALMQLAGVAACNVEAMQVLLVKGEGGDPMLHRRLSARGATVRELVCYRRVCPPAITAAVWKEQKFADVDGVLITSGDGLTNLHAMLGANMWAALAPKPFIVPSDRVAQLAKDLSLRHTYVSKSAGMLDMLSQAKQVCT